MVTSSPKSEPLVDYLEPRFGNIYEYNLNSGDAGIEIQEWTDDLKVAVRHYLKHELPADVACRLFVTDAAEPLGVPAREAAADGLIDSHEPWEVALEVHKAAVAAVPTLDQLIGSRTDWGKIPGDSQDDVATWLDTHATAEQLHELAERTGHPELYPAMPWYRPMPSGFDFARHLTPPDLLAAWHEVFGPAPSDLTDDEWALLEPLIPRGTNASAPHVVRAAINGMLYRYAHRTESLPFPLRYGTATTVSGRRDNYKKAGVFARMLTSLEGKPDAARLVEWLRVTTGVDLTVYESVPTSLIRAWARAKGYAVPAHGRLPVSLVMRYQEEAA